jgi:aspartate racemase
MRCIGIVGGISPESTAHYYRHIIDCHRRLRRDQNYPRIVLVSMDFGQCLAWQQANRWDLFADALRDEFAVLKTAGADFCLVASNTPHKMLPLENPPLPLLDIRDAAAAEARRRGIKRVALTGTAFTMSEDFYAARLRELGLEVTLPSLREQGAIHRIIFGELVHGRVSDESRRTFATIARRLLHEGVESVLLACTELALLVNSAHPEFPFLDTTEIHSTAAWNMAAEQSKY